MRKYYPRDVVTLFGVSSEAARAWAVEFARHLSPLASPGQKRHRTYNESDMEIFAHIAELKSLNMTYADIHASLDNGGRSPIPNPVALELGSISVEVEALKAVIAEQRGEIKALNRLLGEKENRLLELQRRLWELEAGKG